MKGVGGKWDGEMEGERRGKSAGSGTVIAGSLRNSASPVHFSAEKSHYSHC